MINLKERLDYLEIINHQVLRCKSIHYINLLKYDYLVFNNINIFYDYKFIFVDTLTISIKSVYKFL